MPNLCFFLTDNDKKSILAFGVDKVISSEISSNDPSKLQEFLTEYHNEFRFGYISYDFFDTQRSKYNEEGIGFQKFGFFVPQYVVEIKGEGAYHFLKGEKTEYSLQILTDFFKTEQILPMNQITLKSKLSKEEYFSKVHLIQQKIENGEAEGITFCQDFYAKNVEINPLSTYFELNRHTSAPFSAYLQWDDSYLLSASPERFIQKIGQKLITQPIKGTAKRGNSREEDEQIRNYLLHDPKELSENKMVAEMVLEEMKLVGRQNTAKIEELQGLYSFKTVHQLISTVSCKVDKNEKFVDILEKLFPMGSMTGVPKQKSIQILRDLENFQRGLYSGSVGYFTPNGDFDFNVIIRSILYNKQTKFLSCPVGGAITLQSIPEKEYEECLLKVNALQKTLKTNE